VVVVAFLLLIVGVGTEAGVARTDPGKLVTFTVPDGWTERDTSNGIRFGRADAPSERTVLAVLARPRDPGHDIEKQRATRRSQIEQQGARLTVDKTQRINDWDVWESVMETAGGSPLVMHTFHFFSQDVQAEAWLTATKATYPKYQGDLRAVVESLRRLKH
jgi:hypothetical protein